MDSILFEKQEAALCAQHALNMLLQNQLFSVQELAEIAKRLDQQENSMLEEDARNKKSQNMNESGFFSIQVIAEALKAFDLEIHNIEHPSMAAYKENPLTAVAFLCNHHEHWFVLRRFGKQWFELNSLKRGPELLSDTFISLFLHQLAAEGYSIFVVQGVLPDSEADQLISLCPVVLPPPKEKQEPGIIKKIFDNIGRRLGSATEPSDNKEDSDMAIAMAMSLQSGGTNDDEEMMAAIRASLAEREKGQASSSQLHDEDSKTEGEKNNAPIVEETPILTNSTENSSKESSPHGSTENIINVREQQRKDREAFLKRFQ